MGKVLVLLGTAVSGLLLAFGLGCAAGYSAGDGSGAAPACPSSTSAAHPHASPAPTRAAGRG